MPCSLFFEPSKLSGELVVPPSKSHTLRAIFLGGTVENALESPDVDAMRRAVRDFGEKPIDCGNSGIVLRFMSARAALHPFKTILTGDHSILHNRPMKPLLSALEQLGAKTAVFPDHFEIQGPMTGGVATLDGADSQPVSALLFACSEAPFSTEIHVTNPGEKPWIDLTLSWLDRLGFTYERRGYTYYRVSGHGKIPPFHYRVPGDFSTAAFGIAAALITGSEITLKGLDMNDVQGDKKVIDVLREMGARIENFTVYPSKLRGMVIDVNDFIDALPILAVIGCFAEGRTEIVNGAIARTKESDRIHAIATELRKMGAKIEERVDGLVIEKSELRGAVVEGHKDHRIALSLAVAALGAVGETEVMGTECIAKTYDTFVEDFRKIGAKVESNLVRI